MYYDQDQKVPGSSEVVTDHVFTEVWNEYRPYTYICCVNLYYIVKNRNYFVIITILLKTECKIFLS